MLRLLLVSVLMVASIVADTRAETLPAFPGAQGFGSETTGGSGRHRTPFFTSVFRVTTLANSGAGSLRECIDAAGPRVCVFEVSGRIGLSEILEITEPYLTVAGQTAPSPGVVLTGAGVKISTHDIVVQHLAIRVGDAPEGPKPGSRDGVTIDGSSAEAFNIVLDHLSISWSIDENFSTYGEKVRDITLSNSIVSEGLYRSIHPEGPHSMGVLIGVGSRRISIHSSLLAHNYDRNPRQREDTSLEFVNNVVYNWGGRSGAHQANPSDTNSTHKSTLLNFAGNVYRPGPDSPKRAPVYSKPRSNELRVFVKSNIGPTRSRDTGSEWAIADLPESPYRSPTPAFPLSGVQLRKADETLRTVLKTAGAIPSHRNEVDARVVREVQLGEGFIRDCVAGCPKPAGGWPVMELRRRPLSLPSAVKDTDGNGYTDLEDTLSCYAKAVEEGKPATCP